MFFYGCFGHFSPDKDSGDDPEMLADERILAPGLTIVEEEGSLSAADLGGNSGPNESNSYSCCRKLLQHQSKKYIIIFQAQLCTE